MEARQTSRRSWSCRGVGVGPDSGELADDVELFTDEVHAVPRQPENFATAEAEDKVQDQLSGSGWASRTTKRPDLFCSWSLLKSASFRVSSCSFDPSGASTS